MYDDLKGRTVLVTGAGKRTGIGYAIAGKLAGCGADLVIADLGGKPQPGAEVAMGTTEEMETIAADLAARYGVKTLAAELDVTDGGSVSRVVEAVAETFGRLDVLVNNAGASFGVPSAIHTYDEDAWLRTIDVNLHGVFRTSKAFTPMLTDSKGRIVNIASRAAKVPPLFNGAYAVAKAGVVMLTKVMAKELAGMGIRVNAICPGIIMTDLQRWRFDLEAQFFGSTAEEREREMCKTIPLGRVGQPSEVADLAAFLASAESSYMTGQALNVTGGQLMEC